jgi:hypothetical protein
MPEPTAPIPNPAEEQKPSLIKEAATKDTVLSQATDQQTEEQKQAQETENKRLLEADESTLSKEDQDKKAVLVKTQEEKRLLETPDEQLSDPDKAKKAEIVKAQEADAKAKEVPEKYEFKVPEGMTLDQGLVDKISPVLKELKISQAGAQKIADIYAENQKAVADAQAENFKQFLKESYDETVKALGVKYKEELAYVAKVRDRFLSPETQEMLDASGLSNNKAFILDLIKLGRLISEDKIATGASETPAGAKSAAEKLYPEQGKK